MCGIRSRKLQKRFMHACSSVPKQGRLATETELEVDYLGGTHELVPNDTLSRITLANLQSLSNA